MWCIKKKKKNWSRDGVDRDTGHLKYMYYLETVIFKKIVLNLQQEKQ